MPDLKDPQHTPGQPGRFLAKRWKGEMVRPRRFELLTYSFGGYRA